MVFTYHLSIEDITSESKIICILQIHGIKFTSKSFQIYSQVKQVMVIKNNIFNKCCIKTGNSNEIQNKNYLDSKSNFYFTHSYYVDPDNKELISSFSNYENFKYCSSISKDNVFATQFHPEKSAETGLKMYNNFRNVCLSN